MFLLIIGAKSDIAKEIAKIYAKNGYDLYLAGRNIEELKEFQSDLKIRYQREIELKEFDITRNHYSFYNSLKEKPIGVIVVSGYMPLQERAEKDLGEAVKTINTNFTGVVEILNIVANDFEKRREGFIIGVSSVAGDRGRAKNYIYGSSKAGLTAYLSGLRNRLYKNNIQVLTVKPGFVKTKMTKDLDLPEKLTALPSEVAKDIFNAQQNGKDILYTKWIWRYIMLIIKSIPEAIFKKMNI